MWRAARCFGNVKIEEIRAAIAHWDDSGETIAKVETRVKVLAKYFEKFISTPTNLTGLLTSFDVYSRFLQVQRLMAIEMSPERGLPVRG